MNHPNIINVVDVFEDDHNLQIVTELCTGGELFDSIIAKTNSPEGHYSEHDAATLVRKALSAIDHCHSDHDIVHRDLKPENFLFKGPGPGEGDPVIIDFGLSKMVDRPDEHMATRVGTPYYIAPEVLGRNYGKPCDIWSIGVITYILLCGYPPFYGDNDTQIFKMIRVGKFDFPEQEWHGISAEAKDFITQLLNLDPDLRPTASSAQNHPWFSASHAEPVPVPVASRLTTFVGMSRLKKHALMVIAEHMTEAEISHIKGVFEAIDTDRSGTLSISELQQALIDYPDIAGEIQKLMDGIDLDGDQSIDYNEFVAATLSRNVFIREENIRVAFEFFDKDATGSITVSNLVEIFGSEQHAREVIGDADANGDMEISPEEFKAMMTAKQPSRKATLHHTGSHPADEKAAAAAE